MFRSPRVADLGGWLRRGRVVLWAFGRRALYETAPDQLFEQIWREQADDEAPCRSMKTVKRFPQVTTVEVVGERTVRVGFDDGVVLDHEMTPLIDRGGIWAPL